MSLLKNNSQNHQKGSSYIEILIAVLVLSLGIMGCGAIIINVLKNHHNGQTRAQAIWLTNDIIDRMRANKTTAIPSVAGTASPYSLAFNTIPKGTSVVSQDLIQWRQAIANTIPSGTGSINVNPVTKKVLIVIRWDNSNVTGGSAAQTLSVETHL